MQLSRLVIQTRLLKKGLEALSVSACGIAMATSSSAPYIPATETFVDLSTAFDSSSDEDVLVPPIPRKRQREKPCASSIVPLLFCAVMTLLLVSDPHATNKKKSVT